MLFPVGNLQQRVDDCVKFLCGFMVPASWFSSFHYRALKPATPCKAVFKNSVALEKSSVELPGACIPFFS